MGEPGHPLYRLFDPGSMVNDADDQQGTTQEGHGRTNGNAIRQTARVERGPGGSEQGQDGQEEDVAYCGSPERITMSKKRDPDIMAIDHAYRALRKSTPRMLKSNCEFVVYLIERFMALQARKEKKGAR